MTTSVHFDAVAAVRHHFELADQEGRPRPGRPTLIAATGLSDHKVKVAIATIKEGEATKTGGAMPTPADDGMASPADDTSRTVGSGHNFPNLAIASTGDRQPQTRRTSRSPSGSPETDLTPAHAGDAPETTSGSTSTNSKNQSLTRHRIQHQTIDDGVLTDQAMPSPGQPEGSSLAGADDASFTSKAPASPPAHQHLEAGDQPPTLSATEPARSPARSTSGLVVSWAGFMFGAVMSIAANVLHTWLPADTQPPSWTPGIGPQIGAGVWPVTLVLSVEVLSRVRWQRGWHWCLVRFGGGGIIAFGSFAISYGHICGLLTAWHYQPIAAAIGPLVLDGLMTISGFALLTTKRSNTQDRVETETS